MALTTGDRQHLYTRLAPVIGDQEAETLLDQFPASTDAQLSTVADLRAVEARLDHRIDLVEARLTAKIDGVEQRLDAKIDAVEQRLEAKIDGVEQRLEAKIEGVEQRLEAKIDGVEQRLEAKIDAVEQGLEARLGAKIEIGLERLEKTMHKALRTQTILMLTTIVAVLGLAARTNIFG